MQLIDTAPEFAGSPALRGLSVMLQQRIMLTAQLSDALFGLTRAPGPFADRLGELCDGVCRLLGDRDSEIALQMNVTAACPASLEDTMLRIAHELVGNAITHGMHARVAGRIEVRLEAIENRLVLTVSDDGWGFGARVGMGGGLSLVDMLAAPLGGDLRLRRVGERTVASVSVPR
jgi:two-component sensor histidine kinase